MRPFMSFLLSGSRIVYARIVVFERVAIVEGDKGLYEVKYELLDNVTFSREDIKKLCTRMNYVRDRILAGLERGDFSVNRKFLRLLLITL